MIDNDVTLDGNVTGDDDDTAENNVGTVTSVTRKEKVAIDVDTTGTEVAPSNHQP